MSWKLFGQIVLLMLIGILLCTGVKMAKYSLCGKYKAGHGYMMKCKRTKDGMKCVPKCPKKGSQRLSGKRER